MAISAEEQSKTVPGSTPTGPAVQARKKVGNIQSLRGFAVLAVIFVHLQFIESKYGSGTTLLPAWLRFGMGGVDLFFVISGFVMATVTRGKLGSAASAKKFLYQRATRIYPLYWCYSLLLLPVFLVKPTLINSAQGNQVHLLSSFLLLPDRLLPLLNVGWSLVHECYFYLVFGLFVWITDQRKLPFALLAWTIAIGSAQAISYGLQISYGPTLLLATHPMTYEFIVGCIIGLLVQANITRFAVASLLCGIAYFVWACSLCDGLTISDMEYGWLRICVFGIPAALIVYGSVGLEFSRGLVFSSWLEDVGDASYSIYLSHVLLISALGRIWWRSGWTSPVATAVILSLMAIAVVAFGFLSYKWLELPLIERTRVWGRSKTERDRETERRRDGGTERRRDGETGGRRDGETAG